MGYPPEHQGAIGGFRTNLRYYPTLQLTLPKGIEPTASRIQLHPVGLSAAFTENYEWTLIYQLVFQRY